MDEVMTFSFADGCDEGERVEGRLQLMQSIKYGHHAAKPDLGAERRLDQSEAATAAGRAL
jgi:hypothetical protein